MENWNKKKNKRKNISCVSSLMGINTCISILTGTAKSECIFKDFALFHIYKKSYTITICFHISLHRCLDGTSILNS